MFRLYSPRYVLAEIRRSPNAPWWARRLFKEVEQHLSLATFHGKPLIDTPMTAAAVEAVLMEAVAMVRQPKPSELMPGYRGLDS